MSVKRKYTTMELLLMALAIVTLLYFPYKMIVEYEKDAAAAALYKK
jgi:hypothetical protein